MTAGFGPAVNAFVQAGQPELVEEISGLLVIDEQHP
jgi:hypothetical protein